MGKKCVNYNMSDLFKQAKWRDDLADGEVSFLRDQLYAINTCDWEQNSTIKLHLGILSFGLCVESNQHNKALIRSLYETFQIILWGNEYPKERIICVWDMEVLKDIPSSVIESIRQMACQES
uniref:Uncharacterized protein n=1 Tax=Prevotella sp. GTC17260 TaxID=3236796 RepID=A0AB33JJT6_9BACT